MKHCPCTSSLPYHSCCRPYHTHLKKPKKAVELMRSRFSAYALSLADYIIETTHAKNPHFLSNKKLWTQQILNFSDHTFFDDLIILEENEKNHQGYVHFLAKMREKKAPYKNISFYEKSLFIKEGDQWFYLSGETKPYCTEEPK